MKIINIQNIDIEIHPGVGSFLIHHNIKLPATYIGTIRSYIYRANVYYSIDDWMQHMRLYNNHIDADKFKKQFFIELAKTGI